MRLIDADELLKGKEDHQMISTHLIWNAPTIDALEVVRCKDCKHYDSHDHRCKVWNHGINVEDFCSRGERKEE